LGFAQKNIHLLQSHKSKVPLNILFEGALALFAKEDILPQENILSPPM